MGALSSVDALLTGQFLSFIFLFKIINMETS